MMKIARISESTKGQRTLKPYNVFRDTKCSEQMALARQGTEGRCKTREDVIAINNCRGGLNHMLLLVQSVASCNILGKPTVASVLGSFRAARKGDTRNYLPDETKIAAIGAPIAVRVKSQHLRSRQLIRAQSFFVT